MFFFFNDTATTEIYTLSLHDALPICTDGTIIISNSQSKLEVLFAGKHAKLGELIGIAAKKAVKKALFLQRSEEHTSELQSRQYLVCRLLLEKNTSHFPSRRLR